MKHATLFALFAMLAVSGAAFAALPIAVGGVELQKTVSGNDALIYPSPWYYGDYPNLIVFRGVSAGDKVEPAVALFLEPKLSATDFGYESAYLIIGGVSRELELKNMEIDQARQTLVLGFSTRDGELRLVIKQHNYGQLMAAGTFGDGILNMWSNQGDPIFTMTRDGAEPMPLEEPVKEAV